MISFVEALSILEMAVDPSSFTNVPIKEGLHRVLSSDVFAPVDAPPFHQSAMDGYAVNCENTDLSKPVPVRFEIPAGSTQMHNLEPGTAARIFTGAPVPDGANAVIVIEQTLEEEGKITIEPHEIRQGMNIRPTGSHLEKGKLAAPQGTCLTPGIMGLLAGIGINQVEVYQQPKVGIIVTGDELISPGEPLNFGQVYESNSIFLISAMKEMGIEAVFCEHVKDDFNGLKNLLRNRMPMCDLLLLTGGVSAGKYDFVFSALEEEGVTRLFHKVSQRPGKPLYAGKHSSTTILGLPGNPASVAACIYLYAAPVLRKLSGLDFHTSFTPVPLASDYSKRTGLTYFMRCSIQQDLVVISSDQESYKMNAFLQSDHICLLDAERDFFSAGEKVLVMNLNKIWK